MSLPVSGSDCVLRIWGGQPTPTYHMVEGLRLTSWKVQQEKVEVTDAGDGSWRRLLSGAGLRSIEVGLSGLYLGSQGEVQLRLAALAGAAFEAELTLDRDAVIRGKFIATELGCESASNEEATFTATLCSAGLISVG